MDVTVEKKMVDEKLIWVEVEVVQRGGRRLVKKGLPQPFTKFSDLYAKPSVCECV